MRLAFFSVLLVASVAAAQPVPATATLVNINVPGALYTMPLGINNEGQIVGYVKPEPPLQRFQGFLYTISNGKFSHVSYPHSPSTEAWGINDAGVLVGGIPSGGFERVNGVFSMINDPGQTSQFAAGINNENVIVGDYEVAPGMYNGYIFEAGEFTSIAYPGAISTIVFSVNDADVVSGLYEDGFSAYGFTYQNETYTQITIPGAIAVELMGINNLGDMVGTYYDASDEVHGFLLKNGTVENIDCPKPPRYIVVNAVNDADTFVGACYYSGHIIQGFYGTP